MSTFAPRAWYRPRRMPPELFGLLVVALIAIGMYLAAPAQRPAVTASIAPPCADAPQPCRMTQ